MGLFKKKNSNTKEISNIEEINQTKENNEQEKNVNVSSIQEDRNETIIEEKNTQETIKENEVEDTVVIGINGEEERVNFGALKQYIDDDEITDVNCNGKQVWLNHVQKGRYQATDCQFGNQEILDLAYRISNIENEQFNSTFQVLEADFNGLRFHFTHPEFTTSGASCSIRKTPVVQRISDDQFSEGYGTEQLLNFLKKLVKAQLSTVVCGMTGAGKTELCKYLIKFTNNWDRIITIEDTLELHLPQIYPEKDVVEMKVNPRIDYELAIKSCLRMLPTWMLLSEARGKEIKELLKSVSTGGKIITTIHSPKASDIPNRMLNMFEDNELSNDKIENMIYTYIDIGIHVSADYTENSTFRYIDELVYFDICNGKPRVSHLFKAHRRLNGTVEYEYYPLPHSLIEKLEEKNIDPEWKSNVERKKG